MKQEGEDQTQVKQDSSLPEKASDSIDTLLGNNQAPAKRKGRPPKVASSNITKKEFADFKREELLEKNKMPVPNINAIIASFIDAVGEGLTEKEYETEWVKNFYRGHK